MKYKHLGRTEMLVSEICLGTMTWGEQNTEAEAHEQLDYAVAHGVNFIDTAELYAVPPRKETANLTERYLGNWIKKRGRHDDLVIATKVAGKAPMNWLRPDDQTTDLSPAQIRLACEGSLKRLNLECIDLYQLHWPSRTVPLFGQRFFSLEIPKNEGVPIADSLGEMGRLVSEGKVRHVGLSNETPWGTMTYLRLAESAGLPRPVSVQNSYNLINRTYEYAMSEMSRHEDIGLLAYSPLASGMLTGKYLDGAKPEGARLTRWPNITMRYQVDAAQRCIRDHCELAGKHGLDPAQMALAFTLLGNFVTATIIGATKMQQLKTNIAAADLVLPAEVVTEINKLGELYHCPAC